MHEFCKIKIVNDREFQCMSFAKEKIVNDREFECMRGVRNGGSQEKEVKRQKGEFVQNI